LDKRIIKKSIGDIDIDTPNREAILDLFKHVAASMEQNGGRRRHNTGVYFHDVPINPWDGDCSVDYKQAEEYGFFKIDLLNIHIYQGVYSEEHLTRLMNQEPIWELLEHHEFCNELFQLSGHHMVCKIMKPKNIEQLAAVLAMIRPAKRYLIGKPWDTVMDRIWQSETGDEYHWKKSHAFSYAFAVVVHMNLICESI